LTAGLVGVGGGVPAELEQALHEALAANREGRTAIVNVVMTA
jgi:hypothetical protein